MNVLDLIEYHVPWTNRSIDYFSGRLKEIHKDTLINPEKFDENKKLFTRFLKYYHLMLDLVVDYFIENPAKTIKNNFRLKMLCKYKNKIIKELIIDEEIKENLVMIKSSIEEEQKRMSSYNGLVNEYQNIFKLIDEYQISKIIEQGTYELTEYFCLNKKLIKEPLITS